jgi:hypothetical protein
VARCEIHLANTESLEARKVYSSLIECYRAKISKIERQRQLPRLVT